MPGIFPTDSILLTMLELGIDDMRKNPWLIDHMMEDFVAGKYLREKWGAKQVDACKEWFLNNQIDIYLRPRDDRDRLPCITIELGGSMEKGEMRLLGDLSPYTTKLLPNQIGKPIPYIIKPFSPLDYTEATGALDVGPEVDLSLVAKGMILVNPAKGTGYRILGIGPSKIFIEPNQYVEATQFGVLPQNQFYQARVKHTYFEESHHIKCHAHGDIQNTLWLWAICKYTILRYRQSLLEANGFAQSTISSGSPDLNDEWTTNGGEKAYTRGMTLTGQIVNTWLDAPHRIIETVRLGEEEDCEFVGGIQIISNSNSPDFIQQTPQLWTTVEDDSDNEDD